MKHALVAPLWIAAAFFLGSGAAYASCRAQVDCQGTAISCDGQSVCESGSNWVRCDGAEQVSCPTCQAQTTCCDGRRLSCDGDSSCEQSPGKYVKCDAQAGSLCPRCVASLAGPGAIVAPGGWWLAGLPMPLIPGISGCMP